MLHVQYHPHAVFHPKWLGLSNDAVALMVRAGDWCHSPSALAQRGFIDEKQLRFFACVSKKRFAGVLAELTGCDDPLLRKTSGGYLFAYGSTASAERGRREVGALLRAKVIARCGLICGICEQPADPKEVDIDHIIPWSKGGATALFNLQVTHASCNRAKGDRLL